MAGHNKDIRFLLNLRIVADGLEEKCPEIRFFSGEDQQILEGACFYQQGMTLVPYYVYLVRDEELLGIPVPEGHCSLIVLGTVPAEWKDSSHSIIQICGEDSLSLPKIMNLCQEIFRKNISWAGDLKDIVIREGSVDELCRASYDFFRNPLLVHDSQFNIVSCPVWREGMIQWEQDEQTGLPITPLETINEFKTNQEYLHTLETSGAQYFSADLRGFRDIYVNIWDSYDNYEGRLVICELETPLKPGQFAAAEYLAELIRLTFARRRQKDHTYKRGIELMLAEMIEGKKYSETEIASRIRLHGWQLGDDYVCVALDTGEKEGKPASAVSMCNHIEGKVAGSKAICVDGRICAIVNLARNSHYISDIADILRDGLFKAGFSNSFRDFNQLRICYRQASIALEYCCRKNDMMWHHTFCEIAMDYIADVCCKEFAPKELCAPELIKLKEYDDKNHSELYKTLVTYILHECNTVAASAALYIGRSTLFYRLRKIKEVTGLDARHMANPGQNLYLRFSLFLLERELNEKTI